MAKTLKPSETLIKWGSVPFFKLLHEKETWGFHNPMRFWRFQSEIPRNRIWALGAYESWHLQGKCISQRIDHSCTNLLTPLERKFSKALFLSMFSNFSHPLNRMFVYLIQSSGEKHLFLLSTWTFKKSTSRNNKYFSWYSDPVLKNFMITYFKVYIY